jgi:hypothetical protein
MSTWLALIGVAVLALVATPTTSQAYSMGRRVRDADTGAPRLWQHGSRSRGHPGALPDLRRDRVAGARRRRSGHRRVPARGRGTGP